MKIVILHRIPFDKIRYDQIIDHQQHEVYYLCLQGHADDLPVGARAIALESHYFDPEQLISDHFAVFDSADRLISRSEYDLLAAAKLREHFAIVGDKTDDIIPLRNKWIMRSRCQQKGIRQPAFWHPLEFIQQTPRAGKFVLKPRTEASSNGIVVGDFAAIKEVSLALDDHEAMLVEEFIDGVIYHFDGWMHKGVPLAFVSSHYIRDCLSFAEGVPLGSVQTITEAAHIDLVVNTLSVLSHQNGSFHFEAIKDREGNFWFLEVAARVGGAGVAETFQLRTGLNLYHADLRYQLFGNPPVCIELINPVYYGWFVYPAHRLNSAYTLNFSAQEWQENLLHYQSNPSISSPGTISYSPTTSPLSGVVFGEQMKVAKVIESIFNTCTVEAIQ
jgi:biotin carboxylase